MYTCKCNEVHGCEDVYACSTCDHSYVVSAYLPCVGRPHVVANGAAQAEDNFQVVVD